MKVQNFVIEQVSLGKSLSMQDIANYAKIIAVKDGNLGYFMASTGWVRNFMRRYPKMRILYERSRNKNKKF